MPIDSREHGFRTGYLDLLDWDIAAWKVIRAQLDEVKNELYMPLGFLAQIQDPDPERSGLVEVDRALVVFKRPEPTHMEFDLPLVAISRDDISPALNRIMPITEQYRVPAEGATRISAGGVLGWSAYETRESEEPYDLTYTYEAWARDRIIAQQVLQILMARLPPLRGKMTVTDSLGLDRVYQFGQESTSDLTEVSSLVDRVCGYAITIKVQAELTLDHLPMIGQAVTGPTQPGPFNPNNPGPDPGTGGLYATGSANITGTPNTSGQGRLVPSSAGAPGVYGFEVPGINAMRCRLKLYAGSKNP